MPMGEKGTPKSGQLVKWSWVTSRGVLAASLACYVDTQTRAEIELTVNHRPGLAPRQCFYKSVSLFQQ